MISAFETLMGSIDNTYEGMIVFFFGSLIVCYTAFSFLQFIASLFKKD